MTPSLPRSSGTLRELGELMRRLGVREEDLEEHFVRAGGPGGQNVNKVATCVVLHHRPSGLVVRCQQERSQALNRLLARRILLARLNAQRLRAAHEEAARLARLRSQSRRRSARQKEQLLRLKRLRAEKKRLRARPRPAQDE
jgi:protein subunit release factor B